MPTPAYDYDDRYGPPNPALCATALEQCRPPASPAPHLEWDNPTNPDWRLSTGDLDLSPESFSLLSEACDWLTDFLAPGPRPAREVLTAARDAGLSVGTVRRAKRLLAVRSVRPAHDAPWSWAASEGLDNKGAQIALAQNRESCAPWNSSLQGPLLSGRLGQHCQVSAAHLERVGSQCQGHDHADATPPALAALT